MFFADELDEYTCGEMSEAQAVEFLSRLKRGGFLDLLGEELQADYADFVKRGLIKESEVNGGNGKTGG